MGKEYKQVSEIRSFVPDAGGLLFRDDFADGLRFKVGGSAAGAVVCITDYRPCLGSSCLELSNRADTFVDATTVLAVTTIRLPSSRYVSCLFDFKYEEFDNVSFVYQSLLFYMQSVRVEFGIKYDVVNDRIMYFSSDATWVNVVNTDVKLREDFWNRFEFGIDVYRNKYVYMLLNGVQYTVSDFSAREVIGVTDLGAMVWLGCGQKDTTAGVKTYFDNVVVLSE